MVKINKNIKTLALFVAVLVIASSVEAYRLLSHRRANHTKVKAVTFDGSTDYALRGAGLTGAADSKKGTLVVWLKKGADGSLQRIFNSYSGALELTEVQFGADNVLNIMDRDTAGNNDFHHYSSAITTADGWTCFMSSWDVGNTLDHLFVDGSDDETVGGNTDDTLDHTSANWVVGGRQDGTTLYTGDMAELWFEDGLYTDFSVEANRLKWRTSAGKPVNLGADGSNPTGTSPIVYLSIRTGQAASEFFTNRGTGGDFTDQGSIAIASTSPSD